MDVLVLIARTAPMPTPLAIPLSKLFLAHGISPILLKSSKDTLFLVAISEATAHRLTRETYSERLFHISPK